MVVIFGFLSVLLFIALVVGLVNPPLILRKTENPTRLKVLGYWFISYIVLAITIAMMQAISEKSNDDLSNEIKTSVDNTVNEEQFSNKDVEVNNEETTKLKESLERELNSINKGIDFSEYHKSHESLKWELILFNVWAQRIKEGENSNDIEVQNLAKKLKDQVIDIQGKEFPKL
ncbi:MAG TPA: hypothetical protein VLY87_07705, partial [Flavobacterium sp.]|nr:hypothetical protein [Flavobacterium sp.]